MNILIAHHFSDYWETGMENEGTNFQNEMVKLLDFIKNKDIDKVILPLFEQYQLEDCHYPLAAYCDENNIKLEVHEYGYGWRRELDDEIALEEFPLEKLNDTWTYGTRTDYTEEDVIVIEDWQKELKGHNIYLTGAFEGECIADIEAAFDSIELDYERVEGLIVGSGIKYEFIGKEPEEILEEIEIKLESLQNEIDEELENEKLTNEIDSFEELFDYLPDLARNIEDEISDLYNEYEEFIDDINVYDLNNSFVTTELFQEIYDDGEPCYTYAGKAENEISKLHQLFKELHSDNFYDRYHVLRLENDYNLEELILFNPEIDALRNEINNIVKEFKNENPNFTDNEILDFLETKDLAIESDYYFKIIELTLNDNYDMYKDLITKKSNYKTTVGQSFYRGILIEDNNDIEDINVNNSDYGCVYISDDYEVALNFSQDVEKSVILNLSLESENNLIKLPINDQKTVCINGTEYSLVDDREDYFKELNSLGFDGCVVENNYNGCGDDIALFDHSLLSLNSFEIKNKNKWNEYKSIQDLENSQQKRKMKIKA